MVPLRGSEKHLVPSSDSEKGTEQESFPMEVNETGHVQELERNFSLFSICSVGIVTGNTWAGMGSLQRRMLLLLTFIALGGSIAVAI